MLLKQTLAFDRIFIVDNCSTDGTYDYLIQQGWMDEGPFVYVKTASNIGGAGGFYTGTKAAFEAGADWIVLMDDDPLKIAKAIRISRKCLRIVYENIYFAIGIKIICLILGSLGIANMWAAIFADVGVMVIAVLNAIRALYVQNM